VGVVKWRIGNNNDTSSRQQNGANASFCWAQNLRLKPFWRARCLRRQYVILSKGKRNGALSHPLNHPPRAPPHPHNPTPFGAPGLRQNMPQSSCKTFSFIFKYKKRRRKGSSSSRGFGNMDFGMERRVKVGVKWGPKETETRFRLCLAAFRAAYRRPRIWAVLPAFHIYCGPWFIIILCMNLVPTLLCVSVCVSGRRMHGGRGSTPGETSLLDYVSHCLSKCWLTRPLIQCITQSPSSSSIKYSYWNTDQKLKQYLFHLFYCFSIYSEELYTFFNM